MEVISGVIALTALVIFGSALPLWLERVPPNRFYGFRTPRLVSNPDLWYPSNRIAGRDLSLAALVMLATAAWLRWGAMGEEQATYVALIGAFAVIAATLHSFWAASLMAADYDSGTSDLVSKALAADEGERSEDLSARARAAQASRSDEKQR